MKIGKLTLETAIPDAGRLLSSTGISVAEMRRMLSGRLHAPMLAKALHACLAEPIHIAELARHIIEEGLDEARAKIAKLYEPKKETKRGRKA